MINPAWPDFFQNNITFYLKPKLVVLFLFFLLAAVEVTAVQAREISDWKEIKIQSVCDGISLHLCINGYGFKINRSGHYVAGPNAEGNTVRGILNQNEMSRLENSARLVARAFMASSVRCRTVPGLPDIQTRLEMVLANGTIQLIRGNQGVYATMCTGDNPGAFLKLNAEVNELSLKYYPSRF
ncbi:MAG: hypothetical protein KGQ58_06195 [Proteobacteria bacterium]|nr:hypothetical protein [Pseudomonadota bacterium]MDE3208809.1 hypothetical protein [Pseudomonadota bacterium]